jgi:hypothetical protein
MLINFCSNVPKKARKKPKQPFFFEESQTRPKKPEKRQKRQKMPDNFQNAKFPPNLAEKNAIWLRW